MNININKFNKWCEESGLDIELSTLQLTKDSIPEGSVKISGFFEDIIKCVNILIDNWDNNEYQTKEDK